VIPDLNETNEQERPAGQDAVVAQAPAFLGDYTEAAMSDPSHGLNWFSKRLIEILPAAVYVCNTDAVIVAFNERATELWGRTPSLGRTDEKFCGAHRLFRPDGSYLPHPEIPMEWVLRTGQDARDQEVIIERPDGSRVTVLVNISPIFDEDGTQIGAVNCFQDLSAQKQSEKEREQLREELHQAQKMEAVGQLTGGLAHDFNHLLTGILGSLEILQLRIRQGRMDDLERYIIAAQGASKLAVSLTHRLLAFSRRQTLEAKPTDINRLIVGMEELVRGTVGPEIAVELVVADGLWNTQVDPNQLENALLNLCINARDAMPDGGQLTVETVNQWFDESMAAEHDLPSGQYVSLCVRDNGAGMPPDVAARAFDPFYTTKPLGAGTGLGLSMVQGFVRQSGGQARIYSEPDKGMRVFLYLPRRLGAEDLVETPSELVRTPRAEGSATVLVVDDEELIRALVTEVLEDHGHITIEAGDAATGLGLLQRSGRIDLLITDMGLPGGMNGRQLAEAARELQRDLKVLFISGYEENAVLGHGALDPGMHVMTKPFAIEALARRINDLVAAPAEARRREADPISQT
jgi:PAS domain S-box-containing protein